MKKVITFGEFILRLSPTGFDRIVQASEFDAEFGGAEANVAVSLANFGYKSTFITRLPDHELGQAALNVLRMHGVQTDQVLRGGKRLGLYYLETGAGRRTSKVIYDREDSAVTQLKPGMIDWDGVFRDADWFHWTGITPALAQNLQRVTIEACEAAKQHNVTVSCDLNFRNKLWSVEHARSVMIPLMEYVDVCFANQWAADDCLDFRLEGEYVGSKTPDKEVNMKFARELKKAFGFSAVAVTCRKIYSASRNGWSGILHDDKECSEPVHSTSYDFEIVDRVGGGDAFAAGLIYGLLEKEDTRDALEFAVAASCLKHSIPGDYNLVTVEEVEKLVASDGSASVDR